MKKEPITIYFGGEARESWTDDGLTVTYSGGVELHAVRGGEGWLAQVPDHSHGGDVKADMASYARARELCCRINDGSAAPMTIAYFRAAAGARANLLSAKAPPEGAPPLPSIVGGRYDALILAETLRLLLDEKSLGWDEAMAAVARAFVYMTAPPERPDMALYRATAPLAAISALQPRTARLIAAVNEKLCEKLWARYPGDWLRIGSAAVINDGDVSFPHLSAAMCGAIRCTKEERSGEFRTLYTLMPKKFEDEV